MEYSTQVKFIFFSVLIFLLYLVVFSVLHGDLGTIVWTLVGIFFFIFIKLAKII
jgi:hypothetical protein